MASVDSRLNWLQSITSLAQYIEQGNQKRLQEAEGLVRLSETKKKLYEEEAANRMATSFISNIQNQKSVEDLNKLNVDMLKESTSAGLINAYNMVQPAVQTKMYEFESKEKKDLAESNVKTIMEAYKDNLFHYNNEIIKGKDLFATTITDVSKNPIAAMNKLDILIKSNSILTKNTLTFDKNQFYFKQSLEDNTGKTYESDDLRQNKPLLFADGQYYADIDNNKKLDKGEAVPSDIQEKISQYKYQEAAQEKYQNKVRGRATIELTKNLDDPSLKDVKEFIQVLNGKNYLVVDYDQYGNYTVNGKKVQSNIGINVQDVIRINVHNQKIIATNSTELMQDIRTRTSALYKHVNLYKDKLPKLKGLLEELADSKSNKYYSNEFIESIYEEIKKNKKYVPDNENLNDLYNTLEQYLDDLESTAQSIEEGKNRAGDKRGTSKNGNPIVDY